MKSQGNHSKVTVGINPLPKCMLQCSCSTCNYSNCFAKRQDDPCNCKSGSETASFFSTIKKSTSNFDSLDSKELEEKFTKEFNDEMMDSYETGINDTQVLMKKVSVYSEEKMDEVIKENTYPKDETKYMSLTKTDKKVNLSRAKLSAQIMNVPYKDFEHSISQYRPQPLHNVPTISLYDVVKKIKEVYKACSCKVCDCIVGKSQKNEICKCKPCDCDECNGFKKKTMFSICGPEFIKWSEIGKSGVTEECNCVPCECIRCTDSIPTSCTCEPCQCIECKPHKHYNPRTLVVAAVEGDNQTHQACQCLPCDCIECSHRFGIPSNATRHEMSTELNRHPRCRCEACPNETCLPDNNDTCRCERRDRVVRKPVQRDNEFDVRRAEITHNIKHSDIARQNMIALYTAFPNRYSSYRCNRIKCSCDQCECLDCIYKEESAYSIKASKDLTTIPKTLDGVNCDCSHCECEFCTKNNTMNCKLTTLKSNDNTHIPCDCEKCDCLYCDRVAKKTFKTYANTKAISKFCSKSECRCRICKCSNCDSRIAVCTGDTCKRCITTSNLREIIYPIKKGEKLTPAIFRHKMGQPLNTLSDESYKEPDTIFLSMPDGNKVKFSANNSIEKYHHCDSKPHFIYDEQESHRKLCTKPGIFKHVRQTEYSKLKANTSNRLSKLEVINFQTFSTCESAESSVSNFKDSGSLSVQSEHRNRSSESLCNSPQPNYATYVDHVLKTPVETCLNDIMNLDTIDPDLKYKALNITPKYNSVNKPLRFSLSSYDNENAKNSLQNKRPSDNTYCRRRKDIINYDERSHTNKNSFESGQANVSNQCCFIFGNTTWNKQEFIDADYKRAQKTLEDSRMFSQQLLKLLENYEKANREFESYVSKNKNNFNVMTAVKNTTSNYSEKCVSKPKCNSIEKINCADDIPVKYININAAYGAHLIEKTSNEVDINLENNQLLSSTGSTHSRQNGCNTIKAFDNNKLKQDSDQCIHDDSKRSNFSLLDNRKIDLKQCKENDLSSVEKPCVPALSSDQLGFTDFKKYSKCDTNKEMTRISDGELKHETKKSNIAEKSTKKLNTIPDTNLWKPVLSEDKAVGMLRSPTRLELPKQVKDIQSSPILKKNFCLNADRQAKTLCEQPLELQIKEGVKSASCQNRQLNNADRNPGGHENTLISRSCDGMKVSFLTVKKVSDHTVMVKWNAPTTLKNVQGYEILVDGRAVQKILNVSRCMAVVTCVPNADKILLTVRTVTGSGSPDPDHNPSTTVVYRPKYSNIRDFVQPT